MKHILTLFSLLSLCALHAGDNKSADRHYLHDGKLLKIFLHFDPEKRIIEASFNTHNFELTAFLTEEAQYH